jgi:hypothetical protein
VRLIPVEPEDYQDVEDGFDFAGNDEDDDEDVCMGVTIDNSQNAPLTLVEQDEICVLCRDNIIHGQTCYEISSCKHLHCGICVRSPLLTKCGRCSQSVERANPVIVVKVKIED